jgi:hypothetical protein
VLPTRIAQIQTLFSEKGFIFFPIVDALEGHVVHSWDGTAQYGGVGVCGDFAVSHLLHFPRLRSTALHNLSASLGIWECFQSLFFICVCSITQAHYRDIGLLSADENVDWTTEAESLFNCITVGPT